MGTPPNMSEKMKLDVCLGVVVVLFACMTVLVDAGYVPLKSRYASRKTHPSPNCHTEYETVTSYEHKCNTVYERECKNVLQKPSLPKLAKSCQTVYVRDCSTHYVRECSKHGHGKQKCSSVPKVSCRKVPKEHCTHVSKEPTEYLKLSAEMFQGSTVRVCLSRREFLRKCAPMTHLLAPTLPTKP